MKARDIVTRIERLEGPNYRDDDRRDQEMKAYMDKIMEIHKEQVDSRVDELSDADRGIYFEQMKKEDAWMQRFLEDLAEFEPYLSPPEIKTKEFEEFQRRFPVCCGDFLFAVNSKQRRRMALTFRLH